MTGVAFVVAFALLTLLLARDISNDGPEGPSWTGFWLAAVGAMFGFWAGAGLGTALALVPRWANAPTGDENERWVVDPPE